MENNDSATATDERGRVRGRGDNEFIADALDELLVLQIPLASEAEGTVCLIERLFKASPTLAWKR